MEGTTRSCYTYGWKMTNNLEGINLAISSNPACIIHSYYGIRVRSHIMEYQCTNTILAGWRTIKNYRHTGRNASLYKPSFTMFNLRAFSFLWGSICSNLNDASWWSAWQEQTQHKNSGYSDWEDMNWEVYRHIALSYHMHSHRRSWKIISNLESRLWGMAWRHKIVLLSLKTQSAYFVMHSHRVRASCLRLCNIFNLSYSN